MRYVLLLVPLIAACTGQRNDATASSAQPLVCAAESTVEASTIDTRDALTLARAAWTPRGNHHPSARFVLRTRGRSLDLGEGLAAALLADGALLVRADESLERLDARGCAQTIAHEVLPDLAVSPDGSRFAFVLRKGDGTGIELGSTADPSTRAIASAFAEADRPLFLDPRTLLFVGAAAPGAARFHVVVQADGAVPRRLGVEEIPASREGYRVDGAVVRFHDGERLRTLDPSAEVVR